MNDESPETLSYNFVGGLLVGKLLSPDLRGKKILSELFSFRFVLWLSSAMSLYNGNHHPYFKHHRKELSKSRFACCFWIDMAEIMLYVLLGVFVLHSSLSLRDGC